MPGTASPFLGGGGAGRLGEGGVRGGACRMGGAGACRLGVGGVEG